MQSIFESLWRKTALVLGTGFGIGYAPKAPGTFGSLLGPPLVWGWQSLEFPLAVSILAGTAMIWLGVPICTSACKSLGRHDPGSVVYDEIAAFSLVFCVVPVDAKTACLGFLWFRLFDITKPWPCRQLERLPLGWGVMADDTAAGAYAGIALWITIQIL